MIILSAMGSEVFAEYKESLIADYAVENIKAGRWPQAGAQERARADLAMLLPDGLETPNHELFEIRPGPDEPTVGFLWLAIHEQHGQRTAFVYDVQIFPEWRRHGYAERALAELEMRVKALGIPQIGLHVFQHNASAQALYAKLGFRVASLNLLKELGAGESQPAAV
jgi:ribosomal protein S18 acetylase RimI-like enzyme